MSRWLPNPGNTSGYAGEDCTTYGRYCVSDGEHLRTYTTALATRYLRSQDIRTSAWLDDFWMTNSRASRGLNPTGQKNAVREVVALALTIFYRCGYFMVFPKCSLELTTDLVFLGVVCETAHVDSTCRRTNCGH